MHFLAWERNAILRRMAEDGNPERDPLVVQLVEELTTTATERTLLGRLATIILKDLRLNGALGKINEDKLAAEAVSRAAALRVTWPRAKALRLAPLVFAADPASGSSSGFWSPGACELDLLFINHAGFEIRLTETAGTVRAYGSFVSIEYVISHPDPIALQPQSAELVHIVARNAEGRSVPVETRNQGQAGCRVELQLRSVATGPWEAYSGTHEWPSFDLWMPVMTASMKAGSPAYSDTDMRLLVRDYLGRALPGYGAVLIRFAELEKELELPPGSTRLLLKSAAQACGCEVEEPLGELLARVKRPRPVRPPPFITRR